MLACPTRPLSASQQSALKMAYSPFMNRAGLRAADTIVRQMADDLRLFAASAGSVTGEDLELLGWSPAQIEKHGREATRRAYARSARGTS
jgi:hypothetical protein